MAHAFPIDAHWIATLRSAMSQFLPFRPLLPLIGLFTTIVATMTCAHATKTIGDWIAAMCWTVQCVLQTDRTERFISLTDLSLLRPIACVFTLIAALNCIVKRWRVSRQKSRHFRKNKQRYWFENSSSSNSSSSLNGDFDWSCIQVVPDYIPVGNADGGPTCPGCNDVPWSLESNSALLSADAIKKQKIDSIKTEKIDAEQFTEQFAEHSELEDMDVDPFISPANASYHGSHNVHAMAEQQRSPFTLHSIIQKIDALSMSVTRSGPVSSSAGGCAIRSALPLDLFSNLDDDLDMSLG